MFSISWEYYHAYFVSDNDNFIDFSSGNALVDSVVYEMLCEEPSERLSACEAATIFFLLFHSPAKWLLSNVLEEIEIERYLALCKPTSKMFLRSLIKLAGKSSYRNPQLISSLDNGANLNQRK